VRVCFFRCQQHARAPPTFGPADANALYDCQELRQRLEKSEAARQRLREAVTAGLAANSELRRDKEVRIALPQSISRCDCAV
jgi:hypothetical protein